MQKIRQQVLIRFSEQFQPVAVLRQRWSQRQHARGVSSQSLPQNTQGAGLGGE